MTFVSGANYRARRPIWEMGQPFRIDVAGEIAYDTDPYLWARNHILALLLTNPGERVMRPTYGAGMRAFIFENNDPFVETQMLTDIQNQLSQYEPQITVKELSIVPQPPAWGVFDVRILFQVGNSPSLQTIAFSVGGQGLEVKAIQ